MEFPDLSMGQYISKQYTQNVANALSSVTNVPTSSISTLDVRPFTGAARIATPKRLLLQTGGNGVQATYFLATEDPNAVSQRLSSAASDGTLSARLAQYGISAQAGGLRVQNYLQPAAPTAAGSSFPLWALAPIIVGGLLLLGLMALLLWCCFRKKSRGKKAPAYAPGPVKQQSYNKTPSGRSADDVAVARDMGPKGGYDGGAKTAAYAAAGAAGGYGAYKATATPATYKAPPNVTPVAYDTAPSAGNGKMPSKGAGMAVGAAAAGAAAAAAGTAAAAKRSGSNKGPRPESPSSSKHSGSNIAPVGVAGAGAGSNAAHLSTLQSMKARGVDYQEPIARSGSGGSGGSSTLTPWESAARTQGSGSSSLQPKGSVGSVASSGVTGGSMRSAGVGAGAAAAGLAAGAGGAAAMGSRSGPVAPASGNELGARSSGDTTGWKSNVRPTSAQPAGACAGIDDAACAR